MKRTEVAPLCKGFDDDVLRLVTAGCLDSEIREALDCSEEALHAALDHLAEWLVPTAASKRSIDLDECLPFYENESWREAL